MPITSMTAQNKVQTKSVGGAIQTASKDMATTNNYQLTELECKMLEWSNLDIDKASEVVYKNNPQFDALYEESEVAFSILKKSGDVDKLTERQKAILREDVKFWGVHEYSQIIGLDKSVIEKLCA